MGYCAEATTVIGIALTLKDILKYKNITEEEWKQSQKDYETKTGYMYSMENDKISEWLDVFVCELDEKLVWQYTYNDSDYSFVFYFNHSKLSIDMWGYSRSGSDLNACDLSDVLPTEQEKEVLLKVAKTFGVKEKVQVISMISGG